MGVDKNEIVRDVEVRTAVGQDYFHEVSKLRSLRILTKTVRESFGLTSGELQINVETSLRYKSGIEWTNNLIRNTTESLAAVVGGCDTLCVTDLGSMMKQRTGFEYF